MLRQPATRPVWLRRLRVMTDTYWSDPFPVQVFLISHPEGYILFDTGLSPHSNDPGFFPAWMPTFRLTSRIGVAPDTGIGAQLRARGIEVSKLKAVVISHLHYDHSGGLPDLVGAPIFVLKENWDAFKEPLKATFDGAAPNQWPKDFKPQFLKATGGPIGPFRRSYPITSDGRVVVVETPGHVPGHCSIIVRGDQATYFLTGDATYGQEYLDRELTDGVNTNPLQAVETLRNIKELARQIPLVVLPAHDTECKNRLWGNNAYVPSEKANEQY